GREQLAHPVRVLVGTGADRVAVVQLRALGPELRVAGAEAVELVVAGAAALADAEETRHKRGRARELGEGDVEAEGLVALVGEVADDDVEAAGELAAGGGCERATGGRLDQ